MKLSGIENRKLRIMKGTGSYLSTIHCPPFDQEPSRLAKFVTKEWVEHITLGVQRAIYIAFSDHERFDPVAVRRWIEENTELTDGRDVRVVSKE